MDRYPLVTNDPEATKRVADAFREYFSADRVQETKPTTASEDFGSFGAEWGVPSVFWFVGGIGPGLNAKAENEGRMGERRPKQPKPALRASDPSNVRNRRGGAGGCRSGMVGGIMAN